MNEDGPPLADDSGDVGDPPAQRRRVIVSPSRRTPRRPTELYGADENAVAHIDAPASPSANGASPQPAGGESAGVTAPPLLRPDLELREITTGSRPGSKYVRTMRVESSAFNPVGPGVLRVTDAARRPRGGLSRLIGATRRRFIGSPLETAQLAHERLTKIKALAVFSSDALSSVAYATEQILLVLVAAGTGALGTVLPVSVGIALLLVVVVISYRQTIAAYPNGGGSYIVTHTELGVWPGLVAAGSLMIDYVLTVAVSISAGVQALSSAVEALHPYTVELALAALVFMVLVNLRGLKEAGTIFAAPTYLFIASILLMLVVAGVKILAAGGSPLSAEAAQQGAHTLASTGKSLGIFLVLRAFASGCTALTGVEAISDGVPAFQKPESTNARITIAWMLVILGTMFLGITVLARHYGIVPDDPTQAGAQTVLSKLGHIVFGPGNNPLYIITQAATFLILVLAANTSFQDFPRLAFFLARDGYMPHQFSFRGDRLAFSNGILVLGAIAGLLLLTFKANTEALIPLYAVGVFVSFTLSQCSMVRHWHVRRRLGGADAAGATRSLVINGLGATATGIVAVVIAATKFVHGAWIVILLIPIIVVTLLAIGRHYQAVERETEIDDGEFRRLLAQGPIRQSVIVPVAAINRVVATTLVYARSIAQNVTAVHVTDNLDGVERLRERWEAAQVGVPLVILESPYRSFTGPLLAYIDAVSQKFGPDHIVTIVLPEFVPEHWYQHLLHGHTALRLKAALLFRPNTVVTNVPRHPGNRAAARGGPAT
jgi:amino acid transporter